MIDAYRALIRSTDFVFLVGAGSDDGICAFECGFLGFEDFEHFDSALNALIVEEFQLRNRADFQHPAKLPSAGLAWFGAFAALLLAVGMIAFFSTRFGAGTGPAPLAAPPAPKPVAAAAPQTATPATGGPVVLTALADVWLRVYEEGGERLLEKQLMKDESFTIPATAADPRLNTGRPDLLAITVGGKPVPALSDKPTQLSGVPVSAAALLARGAPAAALALPTPAPALSAAGTQRAPVRVVAG